jgi:hypothetical protein
LVVSGFVFGQTKNKADKDTKIWRYEIEAVQTGVQGTYLIKVWSYSKKPDVAIDQAKKNAIHGVIFKGFASKPGVSGQKALCSDQSAEEEHQGFFNDFFQNGGRYMQFINLSTDGAVAAEDRMKIGKEYKVGVLVSVNIAALRKYLEDEKIIKSLSSGF